MNFFVLLIQNSYRQKTVRILISEVYETWKSEKIFYPFIYQQKLTKSFLINIKHIIKINWKNLLHSFILNLNLLSVCRISSYFWLFTYSSEMRIFHSNIISIKFLYSISIQHSRKNIFSIFFLMQMGHNVLKWNFVQSTACKLRSLLIYNLNTILRKLTVMHFFFYY